MALKIVESIEKTEEVTYRTHPIGEWISWVKHGANREPFYVLKREGATVQVIQSIMVPKGRTLAEIALQQDYQYLINAKETQKVEHEDYDEFIQIPADEFVDQSIQLEKLDQTSQVKIGILKAERPDALVYKQIETSPLEQDIAPSPPPEINSIAAVFYREKNALLDSMHGALESVGLDPKKRKTQVMLAIDGFRNSMSMILDNLDSTMKIEKEAAPEEETNVELFKDKEELSAFVSQISQEAVQGFIKEMKAATKEDTPADPPAEKKETPEDPKEPEVKVEKKEDPAPEPQAEPNKELEDLIKKQAETIEALEKKVGELAEKAEDKEKTPRTSSALEDDPEAEKKEKEIKLDDPKDWSIPMAAAFMG